MPVEKVAHAELSVEPIDANFSLKDKIYDSLKQAITSMNIYADDVEVRLDERRLSEKLEISRTPLREALARLEQEGLVHIVPRRGVYIVRKTKEEDLEMIIVSAALESMAVRLIIENATDEAGAGFQHHVHPDEMVGVGGGAAVLDFNGDGLDDILIGAHLNDEGGSDAGKSYLFLGSSITRGGTFDLS